MALLFNGSTPSSSPAAGGAPASADCLDVTTASFSREVMEESLKRPVLVVFWASTFPSSKTFAVMVEKIVVALRGAVRLAKVEINSNKELAMQLRISSAPITYAFVGGRPVDGLGGAVTDAEFRSFLDRLGVGDAPPDLGIALEEAAALVAEGQADAAIEVYQDILAQDPQYAPAYAGLLRALIALDRADDARAVLAQLADDLKAKPEIVAVKAALDLAAQAGAAAGSSAELRRRLAADANDHQARFDLALAYFAAGERESAIEELLDIVRRDRTWNDDGARKQLLKLFEAIGVADPLTLVARRKLSRLVFS